MIENRNWETIGRELKSHIYVLGGIILFMWLLEVVDQVIFGTRLDALGVRPWSVNGLGGIVLAPFLHVGFPHLIANTIPFLVLGWLVMIKQIRDFVLVTLIVIVVSGMGIWLFGSPRSVHLGASSLIFGYFGFLLLRGYFERSPHAIFFSVIVGVLYGGLLWGVLPQANGISWQGHLFGFIGGGLAAYWMADRPGLYLADEDLSGHIRILDE